MSLGRLTVLSALGEPLRAEIDVPDISPDEASALRIGVAPPESFTAAGLDYNPVLMNLQTSLQHRPDGRTYVKLGSERAINDPFIDMIIDAQWATGRVMRDYTMLFDPPSLHYKTAPAPTLAQVPTTAPAATPAAPPAPAPAPAVLAPAAPSTPATKPAPAPLAQAARPAVTSMPNPKAAPPAPASVASQVTVHSGATASQIALTNKPSDVSLDQMLVALLRANPQAFIADNVNRVRAGAVLDMPDAQQALAVPAEQATQIVLAQSKDFNAYRRGLASSAPPASIAAPTRQAQGSVEAKVEEKKPGTSAPDKLILSKGAVQGKLDAAQIAKERAAHDAAQRAAELAQNIEDLKKVNAAALPAPAAAASQASHPGLAVTVTTAVASAPAKAVSAPAVASAPAMAVSSAVVAPSSSPLPKASAPHKSPPLPLPVEEPSLLDSLLDNPLLLPGAAFVLAALGGLGFYRWRQRRKAPSDSSFLESKLQPDSFFGASGGQRVDTAGSGPATGSSMLYSSSQLDAADDVDPVAEADVYLAYGRDVQAEEILKEAARSNPSRLSIHTKLAEIYAKRRDTKKFQSVASKVHGLTEGTGPDWTRICDMGLSIDPENPLYRPGGEPLANNSQLPTDAGNSGLDSVSAPLSAQARLASESGAVDVDLDLDFSLDDAANQATQAIAPQTDEQAHTLDFDLPEPEPEPTPAPAAVSTAAATADDFNLDLDIPAVAAPSAPAPKPAAAQSPDLGMLEFDLDSLSLDLEPAAAAAAPVPTAPPPPGDDPLETKLALAEEFVSIGDHDGARALIEEVVAEASGDTLAKAQRALASLS